MPKAVVLVETEAKAKTISSLMGPDFLVLSTGGPLRDLPPSQLGFEVEGDPAFMFEVPEGKKAVVKGLVEQMQGCTMVYLAMDLGPEGEMQAWHAQEVLTEALGEGVTFRRARATELTVRGLRQAFRYAGVVDQNAVNSQKGRRALDRLMAYRVTPLLWKNVQQGLMVGRLQAQALNIVCSREHERETTMPLTRWRYGLRVHGQSEPETEIFFRLTEMDGRQRLITDKDRAPVVKTALLGARVTMDTVRKEVVTEEAPAAFTTETLYEVAASLLGLSPGQTQSVAQTLYEGVQLGEMRVGLITLPYTAETRVSEPAQVAAAAFLTKRFGEGYVRGKQETVIFGRPEAIRPADPGIVPETLQGKLQPMELRLYMLIWRRFMASQMSASRVLRSTAIADAMASDGVNGYQLQAVSEHVEFAGHRVLTKTIQAPVDDFFPVDVPVDRLPTLVPGETLVVQECVEECSGPQYRVRYTEAELVRVLAGEKIGRPATYAAMVLTNYQRKLMERQGRYVVPTELGRKTIQWMFNVVPRLINTESAFLAEQALDDIAAGRGSMAEHIGRFYERLNRIWSGVSTSGEANAEYVKVVLEALTSVVNWSSADPSDSDVETDLEKDLTDEYRVEELRTQAEEGSLTEKEYEELLAIFVRYRPQIPSYVNAVRKIERYDLLDIPDNAPDARIIQMKMEWAAKAPLAKDSKSFVDSLLAQVERGRRLTEAQVRVLDEILAAQARRIEGLTPELLKEMGIKPRTQKDLDSIQRLLDALSSVKEWRPPSQRGKRLYDDAGFATSVREQFEKRGDLSPAQLEAVKRMVARYHDKIANYAELVPVYGLPPEGMEQPTVFGRRSRKKKAEEAKEDVPVDEVTVDEVETGVEEVQDAPAESENLEEGDGGDGDALSYDDI